MEGASRRARYVGILAFFALLSACSANHNSVYRFKQFPADGASAILVDAKQRAILTSYDLLDKDGKPVLPRVRRFCSEPSPDVFSVVAQAFSANGSLGKSADPKTLQLALAAAFSSSEQGSTIPRTQTVNLLRELMFRTCERYLSGAYSDLQVAIQSIRDQRLIVSIMAIESLTGAVTPKPVAIGASGSASAGLVDNAAQALDDALKAVAKAQADFETVNGSNGENYCGRIETERAANNGQVTSEELKPKIDSCGSTATALTKAKDDLKLAEGRMIQVSATADTSVSKMLLADGAADGDENTSKSILGVAATVERIVKWNFDQDEFLLFCLSQFKGTDQKEDYARLLVADPEQNVVQICVKYVLAAIGASAETLYNADILSARIAEQDIAAINRFNVFWSRAASTDGQKIDPAKLSKLLQGTTPVGRDERLLAEMLTGLDRDEALKNFILLTGSLQVDLSK